MLGPSFGRVRPRQEDSPTFTFHDWLVTGGNRIVLLRGALAAAREAGSTISTIAQSPGWLPEIAASGGN